MPTYKEMYLTLARAQRDAVLILQEAHQKAEEILLSSDVPDHLHMVFPESKESSTSPPKDETEQP